jgi:hypothetical protein
VSGKVLAGNLGVIKGMIQLENNIFGSSHQICKICTYCVTAAGGVPSVVPSGLAAGLIQHRKDRVRSVFFWWTPPKK